MQTVFLPLFIALAILSCGRPQYQNENLSQKVCFFRSTSPTRPTTQKTVNQIVEYNQTLGAMIIAHTSIDANHTIYDSNSVVLTTESRASLDALLAMMDVQNYNNMYHWDGYSSDGGASSGEGPSMSITFQTDVEEKSIL